VTKCTEDRHAQAANEYDMVMAMSKLRLFHH
jgi:AICAR transformylase/IMP cyclohydrolase PurH